MKGLPLVLFAVVVLAALVAGVAAKPAEAKFSMSLRVEPARPWAKQPARVIVQTSIELARDHGLELHVVGPGWTRGDTAVLYYRLRRIGPKAFAARVRFPRGGRWRLIVPNWNDQGSTSPPPAERTVKVQPSR
jgi:hypothetical protein